MTFIPKSYGSSKLQVFCERIMRLKMSENISKMVFECLRHFRNHLQTFIKNVILTAKNWFFDGQKFLNFRNFRQKNGKFWLWRALENFSLVIWTLWGYVKDCRSVDLHNGEKIRFIRCIDKKIFKKCLAPPFLGGLKAAKSGKVTPNDPTWHEQISVPKIKFWSSMHFCELCWR